jgi:hypothetical protein
MRRKLIPVQEQKGFLYCCKKSQREIYKHCATSMKSSVREIHKGLSKGEGAWSSVVFRARCYELEGCGFEIRGGEFT